MRIPRFIDSFDFSSPRIVIQNADTVHQITRVLRMREGQELLLCDGAGDEVRAWIVGIAKGEVVVEVLGKSDENREPTCHVILYCSLLKRENFEWVAQKATEVGVKEIIPLISERTVKLELNAVRLRKIIREAAEQSGRIVIPVLHPSLRFKDAVAHALPNENNFFFDHTGKIFDSSARKGERVGIFIGPEGGWDEEELKIAKENKFIIASLGKLVLRAETAAIIGSYLVI